MQRKPATWCHPVKPKTMQKNNKLLFLRLDGLGKFPSGRVIASLLFMVLFFSSCYWMGQKPYEPEPRDDVWVPVYGFDQNLRKITATDSLPTASAGKIYTIGSLIYQVEVGKGLHVIDYSNRNDPKKLGFIQVAGCEEVAAKDGLLIVNCLNDLVTIDVSNLREPKEIGRVRNAFAQELYFNSAAYQAKPPERNVYYVCPSPHLGDVVGWEIRDGVRDAYCFNP